MSFDDIFLPHLNAAYNLARWLTRNKHDAEDVVQEAYLRALKFFHTFEGTDGRGWLLTIVRNTCYTWLKRNRAPEFSYNLDQAAELSDSDASDLEEVLVRNSQVRLVTEAIERLPVEFREVLVLRELEEFSYKEIAAVTGTPVGTVMSRLARGRQKLKLELWGNNSMNRPVLVSRHWSKN